MVELLPLARRIAVVAALCRNAPIAGSATALRW